MDELIAGVGLESRSTIHDERGGVYHFMRKTDPEFVQFGECYFSKINKGIVKAWKQHLEMTQNFVVPFGLVKFVLFDDRENSATLGKINIIEIGIEGKYALLTIPPKIWYGFESISHGDFSLITNFASHIHDKFETIQLDYLSDKIPFNWSKRR